MILIIVLLVIIAIVILGKLRLIATITAFAYPNAKFNAMGNIYVNQGELEQLAAVGNLQGAVEQVAGRRYDIKNVERIEDIEKRILGAELSAFKDVYDTVPKNIKPLVKCYLIKWEIRYLKSVLAEKLTNKRSGIGRMETPPDVNLRNEVLAKLHDAQTLDEALNILANTRYSRKLKPRLSSGTLDPAQIDRLLDGIFFEELNSIKSRLPRNIARPAWSFINISNDVANLKILLRAKHLGLTEERTKKMLLPSGKKLAAWKLTELASAHSVTELLQRLEDTEYFRVLEKHIKVFNATGELQVLELALDRYYLNEIVALSVESSLTIGPTIRFIISKEFETRNLTTVLRGLHLRLPSERILSLTIYEQKAVEN